jgi:hypothetical protein
VGAIALAAGYDGLVIVDELKERKILNRDGQDVQHKKSNHAHHTNPHELKSVRVD